MQKIRDILLRDLDAQYTAILVHNQKEGINMSRMAICELISASPAPRLYISPERAVKVLTSYPKYAATKYHTSGMHQELFERYSQLPSSHRTLTNIIRLIEQPARSFYLSPAYIYRLLYRVYDKRGGNQ